jgi:ankyrin repeat protein
VRLLLNTDGINIDAANDYGTTALTWAAQKGNVDIVSLLIEHNANVNSHNSENTRRSCL